MMELSGQGHNYRQLAEEIGAVLQAAAETAEKMQEEAHLQAERIRAEAEEQLRAACGEARRIVDDARMEADMLRAEAEWQAQELVAHARLQAAERLAGADTRLAEVEKAEGRVIDRLAGVGQVLADALATLRTGAETGARAASSGTDEPYEPYDPSAHPGPSAGGDADAEAPSAKVYFVEFPPAGSDCDGPAPAETAGTAGASGAAGPTDRHGAPVEVVLGDHPGASLFSDDAERCEWAPPVELPAWWTRGGAQA